ncbi:MAG TPA: hypothetical protein VGN42_21125 [Pirellulales bacterium]|nr:hypothetical protein [Pirellulales bacterium]
MRIGLWFGVAALAAALSAPGPLGRWPFLLGAAAELVFVPCYGAAARRRLGRMLAAVRQRRCDDGHAQ